jgi:hypothetical protein
VVVYYLPIDLLNIFATGKLDNIKFEVDTVKKHLHKTNETKSQGSDSIHPKLLKETIESITTPVAKIFNPF